MKTALERIAVLAASDAPGDKEAVARLAKVKLDEAERQRLGRLVVAAESFEGVSGASEGDEARWSRLEPLYLQLWAWYDEWSRAAARAISRRDWLVSLGLAKRRTRPEVAHDESDDDNVPVS